MICLSRHPRRRQEHQMTYRTDHRQSDLSYAVQELRDALAAEWAEPLPCSGRQALARCHRVFFAQQQFFRLFQKVQ